MKLLSSLRKDAQRPGEVTEEELQAKLDELKTGMLMAFNYSQGATLWISGCAASQSLLLQATSRGIHTGDELAFVPN